MAINESSINLYYININFYCTIEYKQYSYRNILCWEILDCLRGCVNSPRLSENYVLCVNDAQKMLKT